MNNQEIIMMADRSHLETGFTTPRDKMLIAMLDLARADEREKCTGQIVSCSGCPPVGSGPWAIMQHYSRKKVRDPAGCVWEPGVLLYPWALSHCLESKSGWSIVPDGPKPMTFVAGDEMVFRGQCLRMSGGQWFPCPPF